MGSAPVSGPATGGRSDWVSLLFGLRAPVGPRPYAVAGFTLAALKYALDAVAMWIFTGRTWTVADYLSPLLHTRLAGNSTESHPYLFLAMVAWTLPFMWIGASMTLRRALDAGLPGPVAALFFVPMVNYLVMVALCLVPSRGPRWQAPDRTAPVSHGARSALVGAFAGAGLAVALTAFITLVLRQYSGGLFIGTPFLVGAVTGLVHNRGGRRTPLSTIGAAQLAVLAAGGGMLLFALEGVMCLLMAWPLAAIAAALGALLGRALANGDPSSLAPVVGMIVAAPLLTGMDARPAPLHGSVVTSVEVAAPPEVVWPHVVGFSELPPPTELLFRSGIAYPMRARIEGSGLGAVRYCEFSTGAFVEPITSWGPPTRLAFDVTQQPRPMVELSPYALVEAPHLDGFFASRRGEFLLERTPSGGTLLTGTTWYELNIFPAPYWAYFAEDIIHAIHLRVLHHVAALAEGSQR